MISATSWQTHPAYADFFCLYNYAYGLNLKAFKTHNEAWSRTKVVMTDKDMAERSVFSAAIPYAFLQL